MFERFTKSARGAVIEAQQIARDTATRTIDTRHVAAALAHSDPHVRAAVAALGADPDQVATRITAELRGDGLDADALAAVGIDLDEVRDRTDAVFGKGALDGAARRRGRLPFSNDAKKALELALREAIRLDARRIRGEHLVLGIVRADCPGRDALAATGVDPVALRRILEDPGTRSA